MVSVDSGDTPTSRERQSYAYDRRWILEELKRLNDKAEHLAAEVAELRRLLASEVAELKQLLTLKAASEDQKELEKRMRAVELVNTGLKVQAGFYGGMSGVIALAIFLGYRAITGMK